MFAYRLIAIFCLLFAAACSGGSGSSESGSAPPPSGGGQPPPPPPDPAFADAVSTSRFLQQASFGPEPGQIEDLTGSSSSEWFVRQANMTPTLYSPIVDFYLETNNEAASNVENYVDSFAPHFAFLINAVDAEDQLRQRMAYALSQIMVVSTRDDGVRNRPEAMAYYQDILVRNALGNYRDLLGEITYSPAMGIYLTYLRNKKGDPDRGRVPDENYAREVMQLFTIGLVELDQDGTPAAGVDTETYTNDDITGLARVFTGLSYDTGFGGNSYNDDRGALARPMIIYDQHHSELEKSFLGVTIPAGTPGDQSIETALDTLVNHPNTAPFVGRQLIQRFVTSNPSSAYVARVSNAFASGRYTLPNGTSVGDGRRGDLQATIAAVLFDAEARAASSMDNPEFGKIREPAVAFVNWARAFRAGPVAPQRHTSLFDYSDTGELSQQPFASPSVFNFYRPGFVAPGTQTADAGLAMPELQLVNAASVAGYHNFMYRYTLQVYRDTQNDNQFATAAQIRDTLVADYSVLEALAETPSAMLDELDLLLAYGTLTDETRAGIITALDNVPLTNEYDENYDGPFLRAGYAVFLVMTSPDFLVQR